ncbi:Beta-galactosidase 8 [Borealophlyctis nickersoniae]|nr:Beta-galactosidase 8 [Borealophlyctis nickersoniae]
MALSPKKRQYALVASAEPPRSLYRLLLLCAALGLFTWMLTPEEGLRRLIPLPEPTVPPGPFRNVSYDARALTVGGKRRLLIAGAIHYPRSAPDMWPALLRRTAEAGVNTIDTYVFWNLHEKEEGVYDFETGYANLPQFLQYAQEAGLYVNLRIGPYVCAEWNWGGLPVWLLKKKGMQTRTWNPPFMEAMERFVRKVVAVVDPYLASNGGPIVVLQMENEYGNVEEHHGIAGHKYIVWAADLANSLNVGIPWIMCQQDNVPTVINTCNGFYCDGWIARHRKRFPDQPAMFTELWTGWFQHWGLAKPVRPVEDLAFSIARFIARGGTYVSYYMWHGGTNFGRWGSQYKTTSYDYDAPLNEYGFPALPKYNHLQQLHAVLSNYADVILRSEPAVKEYGWYAESHTYGDLEYDNRVLVFLSNWHETSPISIRYTNNVKYTLPRWSVTLLAKRADGTLQQIFCTSSVAPPYWFRDNDLSRDRTALPLAAARMEPKTSDLVLPVISSDISWKPEPLAPRPHSNYIVWKRPLEQLRTTWDETDYLWYIRNNISLYEGDDVVTVSLEEYEDVGYVFWDGAFIGEVHGVRATAHTQDSVKRQKKVSVRIPPHKLYASGSGSSHTLTILSTVVGLANYAPHQEQISKGILGSVFVNSQNVTGGKWIHQVGLKGQDEDHLWRLSFTRRSDWRTAHPPIHTPLTWYRIIFPIKSLRALSASAIASSTHPQPLASFAINLGTLGRGFARVNGHDIGRFWNAVAEGVGCAGCDYGGSYNPGKCLVGCGRPSQEFYHVPASWVFDTKSDVEVVVFDEKGGDPFGVRFVALAG